MAENFLAAGKAVIIRKDAKILVVKRSVDETHLQNLWDVPGGSLNHGELPHEALNRETLEEAGIEIEVIEPVKTWIYMHDNGTHRFGATYLCKPKSTDIALGDEHTDYQWLNPEELNNIEMHDELQEGLKLAHQEWCEKQELPKLVRDKIPEIISENNQKSETEQLDDDRKISKYVLEKVVEEAKELKEDPSIEELGDLLEVIEKLKTVKDFDNTEIEKVRKVKSEEKGSFEQNIVLRDVDPKDS